MEQNPIFIPLECIKQFPEARADYDRVGLTDLKPNPLHGFRCPDIEATYMLHPNGPGKGFTQMLMCRYNGQEPHFNHMLRMKTTGIITERAFRAHFNREPGNLVEQFRKDLQPPTREQLEQERKQREEHLKSLRDAMSAEYAKSYVRGILNEQIEAEEQRLKEIEAELEKMGKEDEQLKR